MKLMLEEIVMKRMLAVFILGMLTGALTSAVLTGWQLERLVWEKEELQIMYFEANERLMNLENQPADLYYPVVKEITVEVTTEDDRKNDLPVRKAVNSVVSDLTGRDISTVNPRLLYRLLDNRIIETEDEGLYKLQVNWIIISEQVLINLNYEKAGFRH